MKITIIIVSLFSFATITFAQQPVAAITEDGRKVMLYPDGTWRLIQGANTSKPTTTSHEGVPEHTYELIQDYTIQLGGGQGSIRLRRGELYHGRILVDRAEIDIRGVSYAVPRGILYAQPRD